VDKPRTPLPPRPLSWTAGPWTLGVLFVWQLLFWFMVETIERVARPAGIDARTEVSYHVLDAAGVTQTAALGIARHEGLDGFTVSVTRSPQSEVIRFVVPFEVEDPRPPLALFLAIREQVLQVRLNGQLLQASEPLARLEGLITSEPGYYPLPRTLLRSGANRLEIDKQVQGFDSALSEFAIGPAETLASAFRWRNLLLTDLPLVGVGVLLFALLLCLAVNWPQEDRPRIHALMLLLASCALSTWFLSFNPPVPLGLFASLMLWCAINLSIALAVALYVWFDIQPTRCTTSWLGPLCLLLLVLYAVGFLLAAASDAPRPWLFLLLHSAYWLVIGTVALALVAMATRLVLDRGRRGFERSTLAFCFSALAMDRLGSIHDLHAPFDPSLPLSLSWTPVIGSLLGVSIVFALAREAAQARRTVVEANRVLSRTLAQREVELAASFAERREILRQSAVLEERARIVRDMHDGVGGRLVRLQAQLRTEGFEAEAVSIALDESLDELRLIVDALDSAEDGLQDALIAFERRLRQQAGRCRISATYAQGAAPDRFGARVILQVLRILQEAVSNALRHGGASALHLSLDFDAESRRLQLSLQDNGCGGVGEAAEGRGLANMRQRAASIGADLEVHSDARGSRIQLRLPPAPAAQAERDTPDWGRTDSVAPGLDA